MQLYFYESVQAWTKANTKLDLDDYVRTHCALAGPAGFMQLAVSLVHRPGCVA
jgi:hypothetical protein